MTMAPSWDAWEPLILGHGYRFAFFDSLNRYYVADEHGGLATRLAAAPDAFPAAVQPCAFKPALDDPAHPDHGLALLLAGTEMVRLPLLPPDEVAERLRQASSRTTSRDLPPGPILPRCTNACSASPRRPRGTPRLRFGPAPASATSTGTR